MGVQCVGFRSRSQGFGFRFSGCFIAVFSGFGFTSTLKGTPCKYLFCPPFQTAEPKDPKPKEGSSGVLPDGVFRAWESAPPVEWLSGGICLEKRT